MSQVQSFPLRMMLAEANKCFRRDDHRPALAFALFRKFNDLVELAIIVNNLRSLHDQVTTPYHYYEGWLEEPLSGTAVSTGVFNTDPDGKGVLLYRFNPQAIAGYPLSYFKNVFITAEPQDGNPDPATKVLG